MNCELDAENGLRLQLHLRISTFYYIRFHFRIIDDLTFRLKSYTKNATLLYGNFITTCSEYLKFWEWYLLPANKFKTIFITYLSVNRSYN
jgi:hypothetical protein